MIIRVTRNLTFAFGALVLLGWAVRPQPPEGPPLPVCKIDSRKRVEVTTPREMDRLIKRAASEPEAACNEAVLDQPDALAAVLSQWAENDLYAAEHWALTQPGKLRQNALAILAVEAARMDLEAAGRIAAAMEDDTEKSEALSFVAAQWAAEDAEGAMEWLRELPAGEMRSDAERRVIPAVASNLPEVAARYADSETQNAALQSTVAPEIVGRWAQIDPVAAGAWVQQLDNADMSASCLRSLLNVWNTGDAPAVQAWVDGLTDRDSRNQASKILSGQLP